jgi:hypothetical protein
MTRKAEWSDHERAIGRFFSSFGFCHSFVIRHLSFVIPSSVSDERGLMESNE